MNDRNGSTIHGNPFVSQVTAMEAELQQQHPNLKSAFVQAERDQQTAREVKEAEEASHAMEVDSANHEIQRTNQELADLEKSHREKCGHLKGDLSAAKERRHRARLRVSETAALAGVKWQLRDVEPNASVWNRHRLPDTVSIRDACRTVIRGLLTHIVKMVMPAEARYPTPFQMPGLSAFCVSLAMGAMLGLSIGLYGQILERDTLSRHPVELLLMLSLGWGAVIGTRFAVSGLWYHAGRTEVSAPTGSARLVTKALASAASLFFIVAEGAVEKSGLLRVIQADSRGIPDPSTQPLQSADSPVLWLIGMLLVSGFVLYYSVSSFTQGRHRALTEQALRVGGSRKGIDPRRQVEYEQLFDQAKSNLEIEAMCCETLESEIKDEIDEYNRAVRTVEARRPTVPTSLSNAARARIAEANAQAVKSRAAYETLLADIRHAAVVREGAENGVRFA